MTTQHLRLCGLVSGVLHWKLPLSNGHSGDAHSAQRTARPEATRPPKLGIYQI